ncbi:uncharacterized protein LOC116287598 [Actinia tenebrosa]|uniref:Uncharacterized protein LOC116287598 n=1 Tax=Actinia tenebrosa TaxID=6105 RepID=A0A6P8HBT6_ACTTE|nr:uncharacterized protein LOC116287598 [Actinia tenebrosa]
MRLKELLPDMGFSQMAGDRQNNNLVDTKNGKCPAGSILSYQLSFTESNFSAHVDISAIPHVISDTQQQNIDSYPRFPLVKEHPMNAPDLNDTEQSLLDFLFVDEDEISHIEQITKNQAECDEWKRQRKYRFTASSFDLIRRRERNHDTFAKNIIHPPALTNKYVEHGKKFEPVALMEYQTLMKLKKMPVTVIPSGFVVSKSHPVLGASPDGKIVDTGCSDCFGLAEVKCPWTKASVTPLDACSDPKFFMEKTGENICKLKTNHAYYAQVQGQMGITGAQWCDFIVYTKKGIYIQRVPFDVEFWEKLRDELTAYYFQHFIKYAAEDFNSRTTTEAGKQD